MAGDTVVRFEDVSYEHDANKLILDEASFSVRRGSKITLMGQNGAGKSTLFGLITKAIAPESGALHIDRGLSIAIARQVIPRNELNLTVREFFEKCFATKVYDIDPKIKAVLEIVHLVAPSDRLIKSFSGGQQARLLLASALIQKPDLLLLDEPTNNLDKAGIAHLTQFLIDYDKTCIVISHDADFLNAFTQGVLYLDVHTHKVEQYAGNYFDVVAEISARVEKEQMKNAQLTKTIIANKEQANKFAKKGGGLRLVAKRMRQKAEAAEESMVDVRREDKTIRSFTIPCQENLSGELLHITSFKIIREHKATMRKKKVSLRKEQHLLLQGPNGIGKSTLLESLATGSAEGATITEGVRIGYYRQDFSNLDFEKTVYDELIAVMDDQREERLRSVASGFLITSDLIRSKIGHLSEGQKGLVAFARLVLLQPGLLILDEPTNHINFRHLPIIAEALDAYQGAMILVSHVPEFVAQIRIDEVLDLGK
ncbi:MAG TPA: ATP-binding cassette domain-containing protein [Candidatus Paceibacterota bacterium]|nr:ATP-binding cassette domain-containing protein [Candidatus Paceibacterota bacterium]